MKVLSICILLAICIALVSAVPLKGKSQAPMAGGCNDTQDLTAFKTTNSTFHGLLQACAVKCLGSVSCATPCIVSSIGLTTDCAACFSEDTHCTMVNCAKYCIANPDSADCLSCSKQYCFTALTTCAGVDPSVFPQ